MVIFYSHIDTIYNIYRRYMLYLFILTISDSIIWKAVHHANLFLSALMAASTIPVSGLQKTVFLFKVSSDFLR